MYKDELGKIKAQREVENQTQANYQTPGIGSIGGSMPKRPSLEERISAQLQHSQREGRKAGRLEELSMLLAKHPDVTRILDLLEETSG